MPEDAPAGAFRLGSDASGKPSDPSLPGADYFKYLNSSLLLAQQQLIQQEQQRIYAQMLSSGALLQAPAQIPPQVPPNLISPQLASPLAQMSPLSVNMYLPPGIQNNLMSPMSENGNGQLQNLPLEAPPAPDLARMPISIDSEAMEKSNNANINLESQELSDSQQQIQKVKQRLQSIVEESENSSGKSSSSSSHSGSDSLAESDEKSSEDEDDFDSECSDVSQEEEEGEIGLSKMEGNKELAKERWAKFREETKAMVDNFDFVFEEQSDNEVQRSQNLLMEASQPSQTKTRVKTIGEDKCCRG